jgi:hypothetical protein
MKEIRDDCIRKLDHTTFVHELEYDLHHKLKWTLNDLLHVSLNNEVYMQLRIELNLILDI